MNLPPQKNLNAFSTWFKSEFGKFPPALIDGLDLRPAGKELWANHWPLTSLCNSRSEGKCDIRVIFGRRSEGTWFFLFTDGRISISITSTMANGKGIEARLFLEFLLKCSRFSNYLGYFGRVKIRGIDEDLVVTLWPDCWPDQDLYCHFQGENSPEFWENVASVAEMLLT